MKAIRMSILDEQRVFRELLATFLERAKDILMVGEAGGSCRAVRGDATGWADAGGPGGGDTPAFGRTL